jgi:hypothetical protein
MKPKQAFQVCAVNHHCAGRRRLVAIGDAYANKSGITVVLHRAARRTFFTLYRETRRKHERNEHETQRVLDRG